VLSVSTAAIFIRLANDAAGGGGVGFSLFLAASRMILASIVLIPNWFRLGAERAPIRAYSLAIGAGIALACHFSTWIVSLSYTSIAAATTLVTTNPLWVSLVGWWWFGEKPSRMTFFGIFTALAGGILITLGTGDSGQEYANPLLGNSLALVGAWTVSLYLLLGRSARRAGLLLGSYITIAYSTAALFLLPLPLLAGGNYGGYSGEVYTYVLLLAIFPQSIGHTSFNWALRHVSPTIVTSVILFEPIAASMLGVLIFQEIPSVAVIYGGGILLIGVGLAIAGTRETSPDPGDSDHP
jgi:drug/metabolite transporter (DMT)-like permease